MTVYNQSQSQTHNQTGSDHNVSKVENTSPEWQDVYHYSIFWLTNSPTTFQTMMDKIFYIEINNRQTIVILMTFSSFQNCFRNIMLKYTT